MLMPVSALGGSALYAMKRPWTKLESKNSFWLMAMLSLQTVLIIPNGYFVQHAESLSTLNVLLHRQNIRLNSKDGPLYAHLMSAKGKKIKRVTPHSQTRSTKRVTKRVNISGLSFLHRTMAKQKFSKKGKGGKVLKTPEQKKDAMSHKGKRNQTWKESDMDKAEELWEANKTKAKKDQLSMRAIAHQLNLPKTTVIERLSGRRKGHGHIAGGKRQARVLTKGTQAGHQAGQNNRNRNRNNRTCKRVTKRVRASGVCTTFPPKLLGLFLQFLIDQEDDLEELLMVYARRGFPFSDDQLCTLAYELAARTNRPGFSPTKKKAGRAWRKGFMCRKPRLRKKNAQNLSAARAMAANPVQVDKFFELLKQWVRAWEIEFKPNNVWNVDETGISDVPKERRVIGISGECVFQTVADEKGTTTTVVTFVSAGGLHVPPMIIFKAGKVKNIWREAAPSGYTVQRSDSGYINAELFAEYGAKFVDFLKEKNLLGNNQKNLLLLDLHSSHLFNAKFMNMMIENNIEVCSFPPPTAHMYCNHWMMCHMQY